MSVSVAFVLQSRLKVNRTVEGGNRRRLALGRSRSEKSRALGEVLSRVLFPGLLVDRSKIVYNSSIETGVRYGNNGKRRS